MPVIRSIIKVTVHPCIGRADMRYKMSTVGAGRADNITISDTIELPEAVTQIDLGVSWEPPHSRDTWALSGSTVSFSGLHDSWSVSLGVDVAGKPALTVEHERASPKPNPDGVGDVFGGNGADGSGAGPGAAAAAAAEEGAGAAAATAPFGDRLAAFAVLRTPGTGEARAS
jgi:hypothetical protein